MEAQTVLNYEGADNPERLDPGFHFSGVFPQINKMILFRSFETENSLACGCPSLCLCVCVFCCIQCQCYVYSRWHVHKLLYAFTIHDSARIGLLDPELDREVPFDLEQTSNQLHS